MKHAAQTGFSIVELMVAMTLSLVMLAGALAVTYSSKVTYNQNERVARIQEAGRTALELIARDLRGSGFRGCSRTVDFTNMLNDATDVRWNFANPVEGFESTGGSSWDPALPAAVDSPLDDNDVLVVRAVRAGQPSFTTTAPMANASGDIEITYPAGSALGVGRTLIISDCQGAAVFGISGLADGGAEATISRAVEASLGASGPGNEKIDLEYEFGVGAQVAPIDTVIYYIRESGTDRNGVRNPALWQVVGGQDPQELVEGIEALQVRYGVDTSNDGVIDSYETADAVTDWREVISVSVALLVRRKTTPVPTRCSAPTTAHTTTAISAQCSRPLPRCAIPLTNRSGLSNHDDSSESQLDRARQTTRRDTRHVPLVTADDDYCRHHDDADDATARADGR
jgi:type IV pilus assembly protein PilW